MRLLLTLRHSSIQHAWGIIYFPNQSGTTAQPVPSAVQRGNDPIEDALPFADNCYRLRFDTSKDTIQKAPKRGSELRPAIVFCNDLDTI